MGLSALYVIGPCNQPIRMLVCIWSTCSNTNYNNIWCFSCKLCISQFLHNIIEILVQEINKSIISLATIKLTSYFIRHWLMQNVFLYTSQLNKYHHTGSKVRFVIHSLILRFFPKNFYPNRSLDLPNVCAENILYVSQYIERKKKRDQLSHKIKTDFLLFPKWLFFHLNFDIRHCVLEIWQFY